MTDQTDGDRFFMEAFAPEELSSEEREIVAMPQSKMSDAEYISKVLCCDFYAHSEKLRETAKRFMELHKQTGEWNTAMLKMVRAVLGLDDESESGYVPTKEKMPPTSDEELQKELNNYILEYCGRGLTREKMYGMGESIRERLVYIASELPNKLNKFHLARNSEHGVHAYESDELDPRIERELAERDRRKLALPDVEIFDGAEDIAKKLLGLYPVLKNRAILEQITDKSDLCYTIGAAFAPEVIENLGLKQGIVQIVKSDKVPAKLKLITALMYIAQDNCLSVGEYVRKASEGDSDGKA
jgi:hypothetical protein